MPLSFGTCRILHRLYFFLAQPIIPVFQSGCWWIRCLLKFSKYLCSVCSGSSLPFPRHPFASPVGSFYLETGLVRSQNLVSSWHCQWSHSFLNFACIVRSQKSQSHPSFSPTHAGSMFASQSLNSSAGVVGYLVVWCDASWARIPCHGLVILMGNNIEDGPLWTKRSCC